MFLKGGMGATCPVVPGSPLNAVKWSAGNALVCMPAGWATEQDITLVLRCPRFIGEQNQGRRASGGTVKKYVNPFAVRGLGEARFISGAFGRERSGSQKQTLKPAEADHSWFEC